MFPAPGAAVVDLYMYRIPKCCCIFQFFHVFLSPPQRYHAAKVEAALEGCYGSLKKGAKYNPVTKKYEDPPRQETEDESVAKRARK